MAGDKIRVREHYRRRPVRGGRQTAGWIKAAAAAFVLFALVRGCAGGGGEAAESPVSPAPASAR